jgi:Flp pilus assembly protein TadG
MCRAQQQKGQAIVEFAIIIPFFLFILMGVIYLSMVCHDVLTLQEIARTSTRSLAIGSAKEADLRAFYVANPELSSLYKMDATNKNDFTINSSNDANLGKVVTVTVTGRRQSNFSFWGLELVFPPTISANLTMHDEED